MRRMTMRRSWTRTAHREMPANSHSLPAGARLTMRAEKFVKVICSIQIVEYTRRKEYRFKQSSA
jgi:hypothetical protein